MQTRKLALIKWILQVESLETLQQVEAISRADGDWWDELGEEEKAAVLEAKEELRTGNGTPHEEVMEKYKK